MSMRTALARLVPYLRPAILVIAPLLGLLAYAILPDDAASAQGLSHAGRATVAVAVVVVLLWVTEAVPLAVSSLLPILLFPLLGVSSTTAAAAPYANPVIFLFLGGFMLGLAMEKSNLHYRFALLVVRLVGTRPTRLIAGFMIASALMSMWISNTATVVMMLPIGTSILALLSQRLLTQPHQAVGEVPTDATDLDRITPRDIDNFGTCLMLGIAYAASIGGLGTLIGSPPNTILAGFVLTRYGIEQQITFAEWMLVGVPLVIVFLPLAWLLLTRVLFPIRFKSIPGGRALIDQELKGLGPIRPAEKRVFVVFMFVALLWISQSLLKDAFGDALPLLRQLDDTLIALIGALLLFALPAGPLSGERLLDWHTAQTRLPWGVLLLFGGGLSLADAIVSSGVADLIGSMLTGLHGVEPLLVVVTVALVVVFLTEMTSNTAVTNALLPILAAAAIGIGVHPFLLLVPAALAASLAFMLPVATPPNAIVFASGRVTVPQMARAGVLLNLVGVVIVIMGAYLFMSIVIGENVGVVPAWAK